MVSGMGQSTSALDFHVPWFIWWRRHLPEQLAAWLGLFVPSEVHWLHATLLKDSLYELPRTGISVVQMCAFSETEGNTGSIS